MPMGTQCAPLIHYWVTTSAMVSKIWTNHYVKQKLNQTR